MAAETGFGLGWQPLRGIRVLDFSLLLPGPFATLAFTDLGADVVKIEPPEGDFARRILFAIFRMANRNKRSMVVRDRKAHRRGRGDSRPGHRIGPLNRLDRNEQEWCLK